MKWIGALFGDRDFFRTISRPEAEFLLMQHDLQQNSIANYMNIVIQFGYMALFVVALPAAAAFVIVFNVITLVCDVWSMLYVYQRPLPKSTDSIGIWRQMFYVIVIAAVITNAGIAVFTLTQFDYFGQYLKLWVFIGFQWACFSIQIFIRWLVPAIPWTVQIQQARQKFVVDKIINHHPDRNEQERNSPYAGELGIIDEDIDGPSVREAILRGDELYGDWETICKSLYGGEESEGVEVDKKRGKGKKGERGKKGEKQLIEGPSGSYISIR